MLPDAVRTDKTDDQKGVQRVFKRGFRPPSGWQMLLALALVLVAVAGLCRISGLANRLKPLPTPTATPTPLLTFTPLPTPTFTATPVPTATATPQPQIVPGGQVKVSGTAGQKLRLRAAPGLTQGTLELLEEGVQLKVLEGPQAADGYKWWKVQTDDGQVGWVAGDWLVPVAP